MPDWPGPRMDCPAGSPGRPETRQNTRSRSCGRRRASGQTGGMVPLRPVEMREPTLCLLTRSVAARHPGSVPRTPVLSRQAGADACPAQTRSAGCRRSRARPMVQACVRQGRTPAVPAPWNAPPSRETLDSTDAPAGPGVVPRQAYLSPGLYRRGFGLYRRDSGYPQDSTDESNSRAK